MAIRIPVVPTITPETFASAPIVAPADMDMSYHELSVPIGYEPEELTACTALRSTVGDSDRRELLERCLDDLTRTIACELVNRGLVEITIAFDPNIGCEVIRCSVKVLKLKED